MPLRLALRNYSVALLPKRFALRARILGRFVPSHFALTKIFKKKSVPPINSEWSKTHRNAKNFYPFDSLRALRVAQQEAERNLTYPCGLFAPSGFALRAGYLPHDTPRVQRSVHAKFHHDRIKTIGARGIQTYIDRYIDSPSMTVALS